jgi:hypothetical protein
MSVGTGVGAELALIEHARFQLRTDGDHRGALNLLQSYFVRFPSGALFPEAKLMQLNLLARSQEHGRLLAELEVVLESGMLAERRNELQGLRAETLATLGRCQEALQGLEGAGARVNELATVRRARESCGPEVSAP